MKNGMMTVTGCNDFYSGYNGLCSNTVEITCTKENDEDRNLRIIRLLYGVGIPITSVSFHYFYSAVRICMNNTLAPTNAQKNIYMVIADEFSVTYKSVERALRVAFTEAVSVRASQLFEKEARLFPFCKSVDITPLEFISIVALIASC